MNRPGPCHAGPYGLACVSCFKAKSKCVAVSSEGTANECRRCHRLGKPCQPRGSKRQRGVPRKRETSSSRIEKLESMVESLLEQLRSGRVSGRVVTVGELTADENVLPSIEVDGDADAGDDLEIIETDATSENDPQDDELLYKFRSRRPPNPLSGIYHQQSRNRL